MFTRQRICEPEEMDDPALQADLLHGALRGLSTINLLSGSARILWPEIHRLARRLRTDRLRVLDIATGAGDIPLALWHKARRAKLQLEIHGIDISPRTLDFARQRAKAAGASIEFSQRNAVTEDLPTGYDVVMSSLFLHHLDEASAETLLRRMAKASEHLVLINDLRRNPVGLLLAHFAGRALTRSPVVRVDAVRSVRAAYTLPEIRAIADKAGLTGAQLSRRWPCRFLLSWRRPGAK